MVEKPTVFVLGAGASVPYGLPTGAELREMICKAAEEGSWLVNTLHDVEHIERSETLDFGRNFLRSNIPSIDAFLEKRPEFQEIGKLAIASCLIKREHPSNLFNESNDDHWYRYLWANLVDGVQDYRQLINNKVKFITFNYDRSLEHFLHESTKNAFGLTDQGVNQAWGGFPILHVYGSLGDFAMTVGNGGRPYSPKYNAIALSIAAQGLRIIQEARTTEVFEKVNDWFFWAQRICFLGFGFDAINIERLNLKAALDEKRAKNSKFKIVASVYQKTAAEITKYRNSLCPKDSWETYGDRNLMTLRNSGILH